MKKIYTITYNIITLFLVNVFFWSASYYPKHILEFNSWKTIIILLLNAVYYFLFILLLNIFFARNKSLFSKNIFDPYVQPWKKYGINKALVLVAVKTGLDTIRLLCSALIKGEYIITDVFIVLEWIIIYIVLTNKSSSVFKSKNLFFAMSAIVFGIAFIACFIDIKLILQCNNLYGKYISTSHELISGIRNIDFIHSIISLTLDNVIGFVLIIVHTINFGDTEENDNNNFKLPGDSIRKLFSFFIRISCVTLVLHLLLYVKAFLYPDSTISKFTSSSSDYLKKPDGSFDFADTAITITRLDSDYNNQTCYQGSFISIYNGNTKLNTYHRNYVYSSDYYAKNNFIEYLINGKRVYVYDNEAICFKENGEPKVVMFEEIQDYEYHDIIIKTCEQLISEGNIIAFEYACEYLAYFDKEFIEPYIVRYSLGDFDSDELNMLRENEYKKEYIIEIATKAKD